MKIILCRHGLAMERDEAIAKKMADSFRPLVDKGYQKTERLAKFLKKQEPDIDMVASSPFVRAMQTAEILFRQTKVSDIQECMELVPSAPPQAFAQWLKSRAKTKTCVMAVGHEPQLSVLASWILAGTTQSFIDLKKSGAICLEVESLEEVYASSGRLKWVLPPKAL
jgi:phosphohistidine phosphatase